MPFARPLILACLAGVFSGSYLIAGPKTSTDLKAPNIIVMMADDMGIGDTSAYQDWTGNPDQVQIRTPNMQRLANMGVRFTDAHSPSSRCSATRYGLLTGRYAWRTRLKYSVIWGPQGDPLITPGRQTIATLLKSAGYRTGMSGKWHVGLTYNDASGSPAKSYKESDLRKGIADGPLQHGFDVFHGTSRSHPTSAPQGWLHNNDVVSATGPLTVDKSKYILNQTGPTNFDFAKRFLSRHISNTESSKRPFFLYYACHSNHKSHAPCKEIEGRPVRGQSHPGGRRSDFIYENDVALGLLMDWLQQTDDPRNGGAKLIENTLIIFTSDNGAEIRSKAATGPLRSNKGSMYEGGHRVPFIAAWPAGQVGDGNPAIEGKTSSFPIVHTDLFATFAEITGQPLPEDAAEDSSSILAALKGSATMRKTPIIHNDHNEGATAKANHPAAAWIAIRADHPTINGKAWPGQWKLFLDHRLLMDGEAFARELYDLQSDPREETNRIDEQELNPLVQHLRSQLKSIHDRGGIRKPE